MKKRDYFVMLFVLATIYALNGFVLSGDAEAIVRVVVLVGIIITGLLIVTTKSNRREEEEGKEEKDQRPRS